MAELPTGTVTLFFTDIEGSTELLERLGDRYVEALGEHRRLLRAAFAEFDGHELGTEGDAFFVAFSRANDAVAAAAAGQRALAAHPWPDGVALRVRMGMHTGEPIIVAHDYVGLDVHRAARVCSAGHGGQVLLSEATRELVDNHLSGELTVRDLGDHRLKGLTHPQRLFQLVIPGLPTEFPPLRTTAPRPMNFPTQLTMFIGRRRELAEVGKLLERREVRLLTLTGPGGTGKTRLAVQVAAELQSRFLDGAVFVALGPVDDPGLVMSTIAQTLGIKETTGQSVLQSLVEHVGDRRLLLLLDNFEQVLAAAPAVVDLLMACQQLTVLVTSRAALRLSGEHTYPVPPLSLPDRDHTKVTGDVQSSEAVALFVQRARAVVPGFAISDANAPVLTEICRRLDGLPLAIELAAARSRLLPPQALLARLERRLQLLKDGPRDLPFRQQTLRATIDWSYDLLEPDERTLFARLAVFVGGCTLEAAEAVCNVDGHQDVLGDLDALVEKNLVQPSDGPDSDPRLVMLETIREYGLERLTERGEVAVIARRHADYYLDMAEQAEPELLGAQQGAWYERLEADLGNFRAVLAWSLAQREAEVTARLGAALTALWLSRGHANEGVRWLDAALEQRGSLPRPVLAKALFVKANLLLEIGADHGQVDVLVEESLGLFRELEDTTWTVRALSVLGWAVRRAGDADRGLALQAQAVAMARDQTDTWNLAMAVGNLGLSLLDAGKHAQAQAALEESLALSRELGEPEGIALALDGLAMLALVEGDHRRASSLLEEALTLARKVRNIPGTASLLADLGIVTLYQNDYGRAAALFEEALASAPQVEEELLIGECLWGVAAVAAAHSEPALAVRLWAAATSCRYAMHVLSPVIRPLEARLLEPARATLGSDVFNAEWNYGRAMRREDAIAHALARG